MNSDLISRKDLMGTERLLMTDIVENDKVARYILDQVLYDIKHAPTAFDKEKVIEEIRNVPHGYYNVEIENVIVEIIDKGGIE